MPAPTDVTKPASEQAMCKNCIFFQPHKTAQAEAKHRGHCLRYPPTVNGVVGKSSVFPTTSSHDWCGEYRSAA